MRTPIDCGSASPGLDLTLAPGTREPSGAGRVALSERLNALRGRLLGDWKLISFYEEDGGGQELATFGAAPIGRLRFEAEGRFGFELKDDLGQGRCVVRSGAFEVSAAGTITFLVDPEPSAPLISRCDLHVDATSLHLTSALGPSLTGSAYSHTLWERVAPAVGVAE